MADLVIKIREYIGESCWNWFTDEYEWATNTDDLRLAVEYAAYAGQSYDRIVLEIGNCYGGYVDEGLAMFHYLQGLDVPVHTRILGTVASMGTILPLAGDTIECAQTSQWMVHAPSNGFDGTAAQIRASLKYLDGDTQALTAVYAARTGADAATIAQWFTQDTWFTADEALAAGLCTQVNPLRPKTAPAAPPTEAQARQYRQRFAQAVARADKRTPSTAKTPAAPPVVAPAPAPKPAPMATTTAPKPKPRAAAPAPKPAAKPAQARKTLFTKLMEALGIEEDGEEVDATAEGGTAADVQSTELDNGAFLYHEGALAQGSLVYNDDALTEATADGDYDTADSQVISVAAGAVTAIAASTEATTTTTESTAVVALRKEFEELKGKLATAQAENERLKKIKPPMPQARASKANADAPDAKSKRDQPAQADMGQL